MERTGRMPSNATELSPGRRMFTFLGNTVTMSLPAYGYVPAVSNTNTCQVTIATIQEGSTGTPADFRIESISPKDRARTSESQTSC